MKFPRNTRSLRNPFDVAPFAAVFFLLVIFLMLAALLPTPGIPLQLPVTENASGLSLPGTDRPTVSVAVDAGGRFYFASQIVSETQLKFNLAAAVKKSREPLTLVIQADQIRDLRATGPPDVAGPRRRHPERAARHAAAHRQPT